VGSELANKLMSAESVTGFLRDQNGNAGWQMVSSLKSEVDRLVGCDLNLASRLVDRVEQLAAELDDPLSKAFAEASRARVLHNSGRHAEADALYARALDVVRGAGSQETRSAGSRNLNGDLMVALGVVEHGTPSIEAEIDALANLFPQSVRLTGAEATRENLMQVAPRARFLHLASHGYFRRDNPMFSFLKLNDSHLHFYSLLDLKLNAEMVTLSACHTGVNEVFPGDELHGLMRGFLYAGAPSVVASLWAVSDRSTAEFMTEMYARIRAGASKRAALRQAQLLIKDEYEHPYYWAPFVLMGSPA
jgi:CHAT domain